MADSRLLSCNSKKDEKFKVLHNEILGRYAVAAHDLEEDELIHEEMPFVVGPKSDSRVVCLECYCPVDGGVNGPRCDLCSWPLCMSCNSNYRKSKSFKYHGDECEIFRENAFKFQNVLDSTKPCPQFECITPMRLLLAIERNPEYYEKQVSLMEFHDEARRKSPFWEMDQNNIVNLLLGPCKFKGRFLREMIERSIGILDINVFEARTLGEHPVRCLYPVFGVVAHSCVPNTAHSIKASDGFKLSAFNTQPISKGGNIYACYTFTLATTYSRQRHLKKSKYFTCICDRCQDPTELGTNLSSFKCIRCDSGYLLPKDPLDPAKDWGCDSCCCERYGPDINRCVDLMQREIDNLLENELPNRIIDELESMYYAYQNVIHVEHFIMQTIRFNLVSLYSNISGLENLDILRRKIEFCDTLLNLLSKIEPGKTRTRAELLNEKSIALLALSQSDHKNQLMSKEAYFDILKGILQMQDECIFIWKREDPMSQEGVMIKIGTKTKDKVKKLMNDLQI
uniref:CSON011387 protein n=1 Tax=Culicoides sonorensis TaxID=179676 RepID=A0A336M3G2_CULSO